MMVRPSEYETSYLNLLARIVRHGTPRAERTGTGARSAFGVQLRQDLAEGFPLLTTKRVFVRGVAEELAWFLRGETNIRPLVERGVSIWTPWALDRYRRETGSGITQDRFETKIALDSGFAEDWGDLGRIYGAQWRGWRAGDTVGVRVDQLRDVVGELKRNPTSRRLVVSAWNPAELDEMALPPCHCLFQLYAADGRLSLQLYQRSADLFIGVPFNAASYAILAHLIAREVGLPVGDFVHTIGDAHVYEDHLEAVETQVFRAPLNPPRLELDPAATGIDSFDGSHVRVIGYDPHPAIKAPVAV